jgi:hypothetical protein
MRRSESDMGWIYTWPSGSGIVVGAELPKLFSMIENDTEDLTDRSRMESDRIVLRLIFRTAKPTPVHSSVLSQRTALHPLITLFTLIL